MPSPTIAIDMIKSAMRHIGILATGETPDAAQAQDGLKALNDVLELWTLDGMAVWAGLTDNFTTVGAQQSYTVGPTGDWVTARPVTIMGAVGAYLGVEYPIGRWTFEQYNAVTVKQTGATFPERYCYVNDYPNATVFFWPVPVEGMTIRLDIQTQLTQIATIATAVSLPPGYVPALEWALAGMLASQYGVQLNGQQLAAIRGTEAAVKKSNRVPMVSGFDRVLTGGPLRTWQGG